MLPLNSIPTEIIRKSFVPYRGFITKMLIDLPPEDEPLRGNVGHRDRLTGAKEADLALSVTPIYQVFADLFGYDPALLQAGNGDCGVAGHDWNIYGRKDRVPQIIRWRGFVGGEALLCIGSSDQHYNVMVTGLTNKQMAPKLAQVFEALGELSNDAKKVSIDMPAGDLLQKVAAETGFVNHDLTAGLWCPTDEGEPDETLTAELKKLRFSCKFHYHFGYGTYKYSVPHRRLAELKKTQDSGQRMVIVDEESRVPLLFAKGEPIPETVIEQIYATSVEDVEKAMQGIVFPEFESREERLHNYLYDEGLAITVGNAEENERAFALMFRIQAAERGMLRGMYREVLQTTFSQNFRRTPPKSLLGTGPINQMYGGHVIPSHDLIKRLIMATLEHAEQLLSRRNDEFKLLGRVIPCDDIAQQRDMNPMGTKACTLEKPYTALYRGLPIRVTESMEVAHQDGTEGLAADYYVDRQNQALHFVALYRVPAPKKLIS
jgi:hypothetical protein